MENVRLYMKLQWPRERRRLQPLEVTGAAIRFEGIEISEEPVVGAAMALVGGELAEVAQWERAGFDAGRCRKHVAEKSGGELFGRRDKFVGL